MSRSSAAPVAVRWQPAGLLLLLILALLGCRDRAPSSEAKSGAGSEDPAAVAPSTADAARVTLKAKSRSGVPLHSEPGASGVSGRLPDGARVRIAKRAQNGRWLFVESESGASGWITRRYVAEPEAAPAPAGLSPARASAERAACERRLRGRPPRSPGVARIGSWNVEWFPDGRPGSESRSDGTDLGWLACAIAELDVDVLAVQEFKAHAAARAALDELLADLGRLTAGQWRAELDRCGADAAQHVGILYDAKRVRASGWHTYPSLNPHGEACKNHLRPGFGGYFELPGGLDLHVVSVHLKSGPKRRSYDLRRRSIDGFGALFSEAQAAHADPDVLLLGDFNTMGCRHCSPDVSAQQEIDQIDARLAQQGFRRLRHDLGCTEYYQGHGGELDHAVASSSMQEIDQGSRARVGGYCAESSCRMLDARRMPAAYDRLSDHCPIVVEIRDADLD